MDIDKINEGIEKVLRSCGEYSLMLGTLSQNPGLLTIGAGLLIYYWDTPSVPVTWIKEVYQESCKRNYRK